MIAAAKATGIEVQLEKVTDIVAIAGYGVMSTPGLVIDDKVISTGKIPTEEELQKILMAQN